MVEMRWARRIVMDHNAPIGGSVDSFLQYRVRLHFNYVNEDWAWTDWMDVPTVDTTSTRTVTKP